MFSCVAVIIALSASVTGCARGIPDAGLDSSPDIDRSFKTSSVAEYAGPDKPNALGIDTDSFLDGETISDAVSSVQFSGQAIPWQNSTTGSSGDITGIREQRLANGVLCRDFTALRNSYDGIRNYQGSACMNNEGVWSLTSFNPS